MAKTYIFGIHAIDSALRNDAGNLGAIWMEKRARNERLKDLVQAIEAQGLRIMAADQQQLDKLAGSNKHQGVVAEYHSLRSYDENDLYDLLDALTEPAFLLVLDGVTDPHNLGACLRSADGVGVHAVIAPKDNAASITPTVRKVASGAAETVPFIPVTNLARTLEQLKQRGIWLTGTSDKAKKTLYQADLKGPMALVMGAEGSGIRRLTEESCDFLISIPMYGQVSSLNVSVATGVCLYEALRQRSLT
ncbi:23S rRNA (guanosine(2251)-2'-O)-methyltransferase RlmB [Thiolinea disciformis]|uniref:23S rRNA (guanosine(2251)-2'-O)-methyltransferase RlmB n=1 Tax=Thiolinea disciformis TaxID=125614 RepID=UPI00037EA654|nr:23S rRNA (guanosine(2251)-2'-O)-methyltransferase RlmB [Thiolinea disciformis]